MNPYIVTLWGGENPITFPPILTRSATRAYAIAEAWFQLLTGHQPDCGSLYHKGER